MKINGKLLQFVCGMCVCVPQLFNCVCVCASYLTAPVCVCLQSPINFYLPFLAASSAAAAAAAATYRFNVSTAPQVGNTLGECMYACVCVCVCVCVSLSPLWLD